MSSVEPEAGPPRADAREIRTRWPGLVWAVPMAAVIIVLFLSLNALSNRGIDVVVTFSKAAGARAGDTPVVYQGVKVGRVVKIRVAKGAKNVEMTLRMAPETREALRGGAKFWLIGASPNLTDISSLQAVVSGVSIGASPGTGAPQRRFAGLDAPPPVPTDIVGTPYLLDGGAIGTTRVGASVYYHGLDVGKVTRIALAGTNRFRLSVFVTSPYDRLIKGGTQFYSAKALQIRFSGSGITGELGPGNSPLNGGIEFDTPDAFAAEPQSPAGSVFQFYPDANQAASVISGHAVRYEAVFKDTGGLLRPGAPVDLAGYTIGRVISRRLSVDSAGAAVASKVILDIEPGELGLQGDVDDAGRRRRTDTLLRGLVRRGYRLQLAQTPPFVGATGLDLRLAVHPGRVTLPKAGDALVLPTAESATLGNLEDKADVLLTKLDAAPIEQIGQNVRLLTGRLSSLVASPEFAGGLSHLESTLANLDAITAEVKPKAGPLVDKLSTAADQMQALAHSANKIVSGEGAAEDSSLPDAIRQLTTAARSLRSLSDYLSRHPEAVLQGKKPQ